MDEAIDYKAIITQLQLENELLRRTMGTVVEVHDAIYKIPDALANLWHKLTSNKMRLLLGLMIIYWSITIALMVYDRLGMRRWFL